MTEQVCEVIITAPDAEWLSQFATQLVADRLCAAVHMVPIRTVYRWHGHLYDKAETRAALHTRSSHVPAIVERTNREHPYEVPCIAVFPMADGSRAYLEWIAQETEKP
jgi:periplasmic divalent cation tolerance protein